MVSILQLSLLDAAPAFQLRDYQTQVIRDLYQLFKQGKRRTLIYSPTGSGKTAIASKILSDAVTKNRRCLFLVHRDPLVGQTQKSLAQHGIGAGIIKAGHKENRQLDVQIASIQSLARRQFPSDIGVVVVDECHTTAWYETFERIKAHYPNAFFIGLTASPWRTKSTEYMGQNFDSVVKAPGVGQLINMGYLAPPRYFGFGGLLDLSEIDNGEDGDFNLKQMKSACMTVGYNERIIKEYQRLAHDRTGIIFCASVEQSRLVTRLFNDIGINCEHIEADTEQDDRKAIYARLKSGQTRVLSSVGTLTEGFDEPRVSCVVLARPTKSRALLFQMAGRGLRIFPDKRDCLLLDFGENFTRLGFLTDPQPIQLAPINQQSLDTRPMTKECPGCHSMVSTFALVCPFCGFEFKSNDGEDDDNTADLEMGELFADDQKPKIKYLRTQIRRICNQRLDINRIWELFEKKWGHQAPKEWFIGAVFGNRDSKKGGDTPVNRQIYLSYLHAVSLIPNDKYWLIFHMELEFGTSRETSEERQQQYHQYQGQRHRHSYKKPALDDDLPKPLNWWNILEVEPTDTHETIKQSYRRLAMKYHPDSLNMPVAEANERMKLLNWAHDEFQRNFT